MPHERAPALDEKNAHLTALAASMTGRLFLCNLYSGEYARVVQLTECHETNSSIRVDIAEYIHPLTKLM